MFMIKHDIYIYIYTHTHQRAETDCEFTDMLQIVISLNLHFNTTYIICTKAVKSGVAAW